MRLLLNRNSESPRVVHREDCPTIQHQVRGDLREELPGGGFRILESHEVNLPEGTTLVGPNEETYRSFFEAVYVTVEELLASGRRYRRRRVCAPDVPDGSLPTQVTRKRALNLSGSDLGRMTVDGTITKIEHALAGTTLTLEGQDQGDSQRGIALAVQFGHDDEVLFLKKPREQE